jgi:hypothetical protein
MGRHVLRPQLHARCRRSSICNWARYGAGTHTAIAHSAGGVPMPASTALAPAFRWRSRLPFIFQLPAISFFFMLTPGQNDLADVLVGLHQGMGLCRVSRRKRAVDHRLDRAAFQQRPDMFQARLRNGGLECHRPRAQRGAGDGQALAQHQPGIELALDAALHRNDDQAAVFGQAFDFFGHIAASHHVQHHIHTSDRRSGACLFGDEVLVL